MEHESNADTHCNWCSLYSHNEWGGVQIVHPYSSIDTTAAWKKLRFILSVRSDFHMIDSLSIAVHAFVSRLCRCLFRLKRHCFRGRWICLPVSERFRQVWRCRLFDYSTYIRFVCVDMEANACGGLFQTMQ